MDYLLDLDRYELLLSNQASQLFEDWALEYGSRNLERMIERISIENTTAIIFPVFTFSQDSLLDDIRLAQREFNSIRNITQDTKVYTVLSLNLNEHGSHHCAIVVYNNYVTLFDPMQIEDYSLYIEEFKLIAREVFSTHDVHVVQFDPKKSYNLQYTGGWMHIPPQHVESDNTDMVKASFYEYNNRGEKRKMTPQEKYELIFTSSESQNRFDYMWCIWFLHLEMNGLNINDVVNNSLLGKDPLVVIKNYIWCMLTYTDFKKEIENERFFNDNFKLVL